MSEFFGSIDAINVGGSLITDLDNYKNLRGVASQNYTTLRDMSAATNAGYQVATNTAFEIRAIAIKHYADVAQASGAVKIGYSDTDVGHLASTAGSNATWFGEGATTTPADTEYGYWIANYLTISSDFIIHQFPAGKERIPATKYAVCRNSSNAGGAVLLDLYGIVVNV